MRRLLFEDALKKAAIVVADLVYHLATREETLPRLASSGTPRPAGAATP